jgi:L-ascorbate metabolism protein UlaG (beta-lactamase superfamily)
MDWNGVSVTWLGHATFLFETAEGKKILVDPWMKENPKCPEEFYEVTPDAILLTHGHFDHVGDLFPTIERSSGPVVATFELGAWIQNKGVDADRVVQMNKGGTFELEGLGVSVTMTDARHSSGYVEEDGTIVYLGEPAGLVLHFDGGPSIYVAGDTCLFSGMEFIQELYEPEVSILPIGDHFTMDPKAAAIACRLLGSDHVIPAHYGTFGALTGTPDQLKEALDEQGLSTEVHALEPGGTLGG